eukprot:TRINITY_DN1500_c0_g1_i1.p2 TRINITY_DN1500_c0_g1~~TRINITY_DN1500_c0_g1_i1.p2  ORF type:complete len:487 (+),score=157.57 TRINITY_DN1500_c0_g1_i1:1422-2882(+)
MAGGGGVLPLPPAEYLRELAAALQEYQWLYEHRFVTFFTDGCYAAVPAQWQAAFRTASAAELRGMVFGAVREDWPPSLRAFVATCQRLGLRKHRAAPTDGAKPCSGVLSRNLCAKKVHEVERLAGAIEHVARAAPEGVEVVVDVGSGGGYLPTMLAHGYGRTVVAVEASQENNAKAKKRNAAIGKAVSGGGRVACLPVFLRPGMSAEDLKAVILSECGVALPPGASCLTGLHACGDLTPLLLQLFVGSAVFTSLCVVGCCYYKMGWPAPQFPMSRACAELGLDGGIGPRAAKLGCENAEKWGTMGAEEWAQTERLSMYRAVLEVVLRELYPDHGEELAVRGGIPTRHGVAKGDFGGYARHCLERLKVRRGDLSSSAINEPADAGGRVVASQPAAALAPAAPLPSHEELNARMADYAGQAHELMAWLTLRECVAPLLEGVFIADRVQYIAEHAPHAAAAVEVVFDNTVSPRCYAITAVKGTAEPKAS